MSETIRNLLILVSIIALATVGWFMYDQNRKLQLQMTGGIGQDIQVETQRFIRDQSRLSSLSMDSELFLDTNFTGLYSITLPIETFPVGRSNPFIPSFR